MIKRRLKSTIRQILAQVYYNSNFFLNQLQGKVLILSYHRVLSNQERPADDLIQPGMYVYESTFEKQMHFLQNNFNFLSLDDLLMLWNECLLDKNKCYCVITFDDGWLDNYIYAYPILKKYNIPATIFLPTSYIGTSEWFWHDKISYIISCLNDSTQHFLPCRYQWIRDSLRSDNSPSSRYQLNGIIQGETIDSIIECYKHLSEREILDFIKIMKSKLGLVFPNKRVFLNWVEIEEMSKNNITFGSHSCSHRILTTLTNEEIKNEIEDSMQLLMSKKIHFIPVFCYPNGNYNNEIQHMLMECGYHAALTNRFGFEHVFPGNLFELKRIGIHYDISSTIPLFLLHLSGIYNNINSALFRGSHK